MECRSGRGRCPCLKNTFPFDSNTVECHSEDMNETFSVEKLAEKVNEWCEQHAVRPANGQAGERITARNVRYYRALGLLDAPVLGGGQGFGEKHRLQLVAIRLLQAQGMPLSRIQQLLFGRSLEALKRIERQGLAELDHSPVAAFHASANESWSVTPLDEEFLLVSRRGRGLSPQLRGRLLAMLESEKNHGPRRGVRRRTG